MNQPGIWRVAGLACGFVVLTVSAYAQAELSVYGGGARYSDGTHGVIGGDVSGAIGKVRVGGEFNYVPLGSASFSGINEGIEVNSSASAKVLNFGGVFHYSFSPSSPVAPYIAAAAGLGRLSASGTASGGGVTVKVAESSSHPYFAGGVGLRYMASSKWIVRPEVRYQRYTRNGGFDAVFFTVGLSRRIGE